MKVAVNCQQHTCTGRAMPCWPKCVFAEDRERIQQDPMGFSRISHHTIINPGLTIIILKTSWLSTFWPADLHWLISNGGFQRRSITLNRYKRRTHVRLFVLLFLKRRALAFFLQKPVSLAPVPARIFLAIFIDKCCQNSLVNVVGYCHLDTNLKH